MTHKELLNKYKEIERIRIENESIQIEEDYKKKKINIEKKLTELEELKVIPNDAMDNTREQLLQYYHNGPVFSRI